MRFDIVTIFPELFGSIFDTSILKRAIADGKVEVRLHNPRDFATDKHRTVDDTPYGGGQGMLMKVEPIVAALKGIDRLSRSRSYLMSAKGDRFVQATAKGLSEELDQLILVCGRYEGVDERVLEYLDGELSIGDFVLTGGELGAAVVVDAVARLLPGVLGHAESAVEESHSEPGYLEYPHYTRPEEFEGHRVPDVLLSGNHEAIEKWRKEQSKNTDK